MSKKQQAKDSSLIEQFVATFERLDEMINYGDDPVASQLEVGGADASGFRLWRAKQVTTPREALDFVYEKLPARFPPLFEELVLSYRWAEIDLGNYRLLPNPPGDGLSELLKRITKDPAIWQCLLHSGYIQFGKGPDMDYDPVCFDLRSRTKQREYRVVKIDHEEILCNNRLKVVAELAPSFRELMTRTIELALNQ